MRINNANSPIPPFIAAKCDCIYTREEQKKKIVTHEPVGMPHSNYYIVNLLQCKMDKKQSVHRWKKKHGFSGVARVTTTNNGST